VPEPETKIVIGNVQARVEQLGGKVTNVDNWGRRRLAYPIKDFREGYYIFFQMDFPTQQVAELERGLRLYDQVLRHLVVRLDE